MIIVSAPTAGLAGNTPQHRGRTQGFTLVEVMVSLAVLSLILLATVSALRTFANTQGSLERKIGRVDEIRSVSSFLRDALQANIASTGQRRGSLSLGGDAGQSGFFLGSPDSVQWKAPMVFGEGEGGVFLVRLALEEGQLVLRWQRPPSQDQNDNPDWRGTPHRVVIENVDEFSVGYRLEYEKAWQEGIYLEEAPVMLRLTIQSSGRYWPDLIAGVNQ